MALSLLYNDHSPFDCILIIRGRVISIDRQTSTIHNLIEFLERTCVTYGSKEAVVSEDGVYTFAQLRQRALHAAAAISLAMQNVRSDVCTVISPAKERIAIYLPKGADCLSAMLCVLYGGHVYVPLDTRAPVKRTKQILETVQPRFLLTDTQGKRLFLENGVPAESLIDFQDLIAKDIEIPADFVNETIMRTQDVDPAYILFTSGSTGVPKGVVISHRRVINYINWAQEFFDIGSNEVIGNQAPFYFTVSAMDIYLCLATGSKLCIIPENRFSHPQKLLGFLNENQITLIFWVSSVYHNVANASAMENLHPKFLKHAWFVGEPMSAASLTYWLEKLPEVAFANLYGSTETDMTLCYQIPKGVPIETIPLGQACANTEVLLIKDDQTPAQEGEIGEIYVRGTCLANGYYRNQERTEASFIQNPLHKDYIDIVYKTGDLGELKGKQIFFHGRRDHQFKHLGYRIEAGEIEAVAGRVGPIQNVCVLYDESRRQIVLFYEADGPVDEMAYRLAFMDELPIYMIPTRLVRLDAMPFNANRKKDRILLKEKYIENQGGQNT